MRSITAVACASALLLTACGPCGKEPEKAKPEQAAKTPVQTPAEVPETAGIPGPQGRLVDVGGHRLFVRTFGAGSPAVVIETGLGDTGDTWDGVIDSVSADTRVVLYARAGYGRSDPGPMPRGADRVADELDALLRASHIDPPYILVGHSLGALDAMVYTSDHPNQVDGLVLLDPPPVDFLRGQRFPDLYRMAQETTERFRRDAQSAREAGDDRQATFLETLASEHEMMFQTGWALVGSIRSLGDLPFIVVGSGVPNPEFGSSATEFQEFWRQSSEDLSRLSSRGHFVFVPGASHNLPGDATDVVVDAIRDCIAASKAPAEPEYWQGDK